MSKRAGASTGLIVVSLVIALAACGSSAKPQAVPQPRLRGVPVRSFTCPPTTTSAAKATHITAVQALLLCPLDQPGPPGKAVTISSRQSQFATLIAALSVPDQPPSTGACAAYADLPQVVLAETAHRAFQVSIPVDACGHYQPRARQALQRARQS
jgi:hypothetical protein